MNVANSAQAHARVLASGLREQIQGARRPCSSSRRCLAPVGRVRIDRVSLLAKTACAQGRLMRCGAAPGRGP